MKESEYSLVSDLATIRAAEGALRHTVPSLMSPKSGIMMQKIFNDLSSLRQRLERDVEAAGVEEDTDA